MSAPGAKAYRVLLRLLPRNLRAVHGDDMVASFTEELVSARRRGRVAWAATWAAGALDVLRHAPREHWRRRHDQPRVRTMPSIGADLRFALRTFARQKGSTALVLLTLVLAVAANVAVFMLLDGLFFRPFPYPEAGRLLYLNERAPKWNLDHVGINYPDYVEWRDHTPTIESMALVMSTSVNVSDGTSAERLPAAQITWTLPATLGVHPILGRTFTADEDRPHPPHVVLIDEGLWRTRYSSAPDVIGRTMRINGEDYTIVGVMPSKTALPYEARLWLPYGGDPTQSYQAYGGDGFARLRPGVSLAQARADLLRANAAVWAAHDSAHIVSPLLEPLRDRFVGSLEAMGRALGAGVLLVLLVACANIAGAMLARSVFRQHELGIRLALGANGRRIVRQLLTESALLAVAAGALGTLLGWRAVRVLVKVAADQLPQWARFPLDWRAAAFAATGVGATSLLFGLIPALQARRVDVRSSLATGGTRSGASVPQRRLLDALVVIEVTLATVLLVGGGLLLRAYEHLLRVDPGFRVDNVASFSLALPDAKYDPVRQHAFYARLLDQMRSIPGVTAVGGISCPPLTCHWGNFMDAEHGSTRDPGAPDPVILTRVATADYFPAIGTQLEQGRYFRTAEGDSLGFMPLVVNESFAGRFWGSTEAALGQRVRFRGGDERWFTVVGVTKDVRHYGLDEPSRPGIYVPIEVWGSLDALRFVVHTSVEPTALFPALRQAIRDLDPELPVYQLRTMEESISRSLTARRTLVAALAAFAVIALVLALSGIYAVVSYVVGRRRHELGIRMALGAQRGQVLGLVAGHGARLTAVGLVLGIPAAYAAARVLSSLLVGVSAADPVTYGAVAALLVLTGAVAALVPARRAAAVAPSEALSEAG
jgi:predicted permease